MILGDCTCLHYLSVGQKRKKGKYIGSDGEYSFFLRIPHLETDKAVEFIRVSKGVVILNGGPALSGS